VKRWRGSGEQEQPAQWQRRQELRIVDELTQSEADVWRQVAGATTTTE